MGNSNSSLEGFANLMRVYVKTVEEDKERFRQLASKETLTKDERNELRDLGESLYGYSSDLTEEEHEQQKLLAQQTLREKE